MRLSTAFRAVLLLEIVLAISCSKSDGPSDVETGSKAGAARWSFATGAPVYYSSPAIGADGTIYVGNGLRDAGDYGLFAITPDGSRKWKYGFTRPVFSPVIGADGTIYVQNDSASVFAISPTGSLKWQYPLRAYLQVGQASPAIDSDGTIYVNGDGVYALSADGALKWKYSDPLDPGAIIRSSPVLTNEGILIAATRVRYESVPNGGGDAPQLWLLNRNGTLRWKTVLADAFFTFASPAVGSDGTIYLGAEREANGGHGYIYAISSAGAVKWKLPIENRAVRAQPVITPDGSIVIGTKAVDWKEAELLALRPDGTLKWSFKVERVTSTPDEIYAAAAIGNDGTIYFGAESVKTYALDPNGHLLWATRGGGTWSAPTIADDGTLYIGTIDEGKLYAIRTGSQGLAASGWPKFQRNRRNTGGMP